MKRGGFHIGPGAASLMLIIVVLSMSVLGVLALMSARGDARLSERSVQVAQQNYALEVASERSLAALDALLARTAQGQTDEAVYLRAVSEALPEGMRLNGRAVSWQEEDGQGRALHCAVTLAPMGETPRAVWIEHSLTAEEMESVAWN
ncbi:MAG: hypothetical protein LBM74_06135 [Oscillospiraceae bacterium]|nr:hypothetical protein [Oscillospiraceae bacterium]